MNQVGNYVKIGLTKFIFFFFILILIGAQGCSGKKEVLQKDKGIESQGLLPKVEVAQASEPSSEQKIGEILPPSPVTVPAPATVSAPPTPTPSPPQPQPPQTAKPQEPQRGGLIFNFDNADLHEVIRVIAGVLKINYLVDPKVKGVVNVHTSPF